MAIQTISGSDALWWQKMNANFQSLVEAPFPLKTYADVSALTTAKNPKLYKNCLALIDGIIYRSDGTVWIPLQQMDVMADLDTGTATVSDIKTAFNDLLADLRAKHWLTV